MNNKNNKIIYHILDCIFLMLSYALCDYITSKINLAVGIIIALVIYMLISFILYKILKIGN